MAHDFQAFLARSELETSGPPVQVELDGGHAWDVPTASGARRIYCVPEAEDGDPRAARSVAACELRHGAIVSLLETHTLGDSTWAIADQPRGLSLETWLSREPTLPFLEAFLVLRSIAQALRAAHAASLPHGQLDAHRVWWAAPHARVEGFGLFRLAGTDNSPASTKSAPSADCLAFGALAHRVLTGEFPSLARPESAARTRHGVPPGLAHLIWRSLSSDPEARPTAEDLARFFEHLSVPAPSARRRYVDPMEDFKLRRGPGS